MRQALYDLVEAADLNGLLRAVDGMCAAREWDELLDLADACDDALDRGKQLWPISAHVDYRIALEAPGEYAASVLTPEIGRFAHGPLTEVAASTHSWDELVAHLEDPVTASFVAQERVLRGETLDTDERAHAGLVDVPLRIAPWEPPYALATFRSNLVEVQEPWEPQAPWEEADPGAPVKLDEDEIVDALLELVTPWTNESNGAARAVVVDGDAAGAIGSLTYGPVRLASIGVDEAFRQMAWAAASGGAHGRRRGAALGRFSAWYTTALLADLPWPVDAAELGAAAERLRWFAWDEEAVGGAPQEGWVLRIAVEDPDEGWAAALGATDVLTEAGEDADG
ncbi:MAG TPA: hypothetical protein VEV43_06775 [Actinomycetota bacterium]|nr:hypothetical protein [Actinomycetota bacterium]